jgi:hypothetical protein
VPEIAVELVQPAGVVAEHEVALVELQVRVELLPEVMLVGLALRVTVGAPPPPPIVPVTLLPYCVDPEPLSA